MRDLRSAFLPVDFPRLPDICELCLLKCLSRRLLGLLDEKGGEFGGSCPACPRLESCRELLSCSRFFLFPRIVASGSRLFAQSCATATDEACLDMSFEVGFIDSPGD